MSPASIWVVETDDGKAYIGEVKITRHDVIVYNGFAGRPPVIDKADVSAMTFYRNHPDVEPRWSL